MGVTVRLCKTGPGQAIGRGSATKGGIIIPDTAKEKPHQGKIVAVGNGKKLDDGG